MTAIDMLVARNREFAVDRFSPDLPALPRLRTVIVSCVDARVDPAHLFGLEPGDAVVLRNNGGRVTASLIAELTVLSAMVAKMSGQEQVAFDLLLLHHTGCGARLLAQPDFARHIRDNFGIDPSPSAMTDSFVDLDTDLKRLRDAPGLPGSIRVSAMLYDLNSGEVQQVAAPQTLDALRDARA